MPTVNFNGVTVDVPDQFLSDPQALAKIGEQTRYVNNVDTESGAGWKERLAINSVETDADRVNALKRRGFDAAMTHQGLTFIDPKTQRATLADEKGFAAKDLLDIVPEVVELGGAVLGGVSGGALGAPTVVGAAPGAMLGAGLGGATARESAQGAMRSALGVDDTRGLGQRAQDFGVNTMVNAAGEGVARAAGSVVKGLRTPFSPDDYTHVTNRIAQEAGIDQTAAQATPSMATRLAEQYGLQSPIGRPAMQEALSAQQRALQDSLQKVGGVGFNQSRLAGKPVLDEAADPETWAFPTVKDVMRSRATSPDMRDVGRSLRKFGRQGEDVKKTFVQQKLNDLGIGSPQFNAQNFLQQFDALPDTDRALLGLSGELGKELNALIRVAKNVGKQQTRTGKPLATPVGGLMNALGIGASFTAGGLPGAIGGVMAPYLTARLMTWTPFVKALSRPVGNPGQWTRRLTRLAAQAEKDGPREDLGRFMEALGAQ